MKTIDDIFRIARIVISISAAFFIVINGRWSQLNEAVISPSFYLAVLVSFYITYSLLYLIHTVSIRLDKRLDWKENYILRPLFQILLGITIPLLLTVLFAALYISATGQSFDASGYWDKDFPFISSFIVLVNGFYVIQYFLSPKIPQIYLRSTTEEDTGGKFFGVKELETITIQYNGNHVVLNLLSDILYFHRDGKLVKLQTVTGTEYSILKTISSLVEELPTNVYCQISRSTIVNTTFIKGYSVLRRDSLQVRFKPKYHPIIKDRDNDRYRVTKEHIENLKSHVENMENKTHQTH